MIIKAGYFHINLGEQARITQNGCPFISITTREKGLIPLERAHS